MTVLPLYDFVLIEPIEMSGGTLKRGALFIPESSKDAGKQLRHAKVVAVGSGPNKDGNPMSVQVDCVVLYNPFAGYPTRIDGVDYLMMREHELYAVVKADGFRAGADRGYAAPETMDAGSFMPGPRELA